MEWLASTGASSDLVAIHDGARPCVSRELIEQCVRAAKDLGGPVAAQRATDAIMQSDDGMTITQHSIPRVFWEKGRCREHCGVSDGRRSRRRTSAPNRT
jgi:2-C-methyl-D-erythritol 4-phosphate cytidylyltransferase